MTRSQPSYPVPAGPALLHDIGNVLELGVLMVDRDGVVTGWNRWLEIASGRSAASVLGHALTDIFPDFAGSSGERALVRAIAGETVVLAHRFHQAFLKLPCTPGEDFDCMQQSTRIVPHIDQDGRIAGAIALIEDVTERVARDRELRQALTEAKAANQIKAEFLATMSHELRTPLGAIAGYTDLLVDGIVGELTDPQRQHMLRIKRVAGHVLSIVDEILTFSRLQAGREELHLEQVDAGLLAREAAQVVEPSLAAKGLEFRIELPKGHLSLVTDELKASQILINLLGNAAKFVERGQVTFTVRESESMIAFEVSDSGPGIAPENLKRVFEPFTQVDNSLKRRMMGTGLGLPLSRQLAALLGGTITLRSEVGVGSVFTLLLPRRPAELAG